MKVEESIIINRSPNDVFKYLEVRSHDADWMEAVVESEWLDSRASDSVAPIGIGGHGRTVMQLPGCRAAFVDEVTEYKLGRRIAHRTVEGPVPLNTACICEPAGDGCRATVVGEVHRLPDGVLGQLAEPAVALVMRRGFKADLARLKDILESEGGAYDQAALKCSIATGVPPQRFSVSRRLSWSEVKRTSRSATTWPNVVSSSSS